MSIVQFTMPENPWNMYFTLAAFAVVALSSVFFAVASMRQLALSKRIMRETDAHRAASITRFVIPQTPSSVDDFDIAAKVDQHINAAHYKKQLTVVKNTLEKNGFRCVLDSGQSKNFAYSDLPYSARLDVAKALMGERHAQYYPSVTGERKSKFIDENINDGFALNLLAEIFEALSSLGFVVIEIHPSDLKESLPS